MYIPPQVLCAEKEGIHIYRQIRQNQSILPASPQRKAFVGADDHIRPQAEVVFGPYDLYVLIIVIQKNGYGGAPYPFLL
jgi:hypothetical protein